MFPILQIEKCFQSQTAFPRAKQVFSTESAVRDKEETVEESVNCLDSGVDRWLQDRTNSEAGVYGDKVDPVPLCKLPGCLLG